MFRNLLRLVTCFVSVGVAGALGTVATGCTPFEDDLAQDAMAGESGPEQDGAIAADAGLPCDLSKPFGPATVVAGLAPPAGEPLFSLRLSPDYLTAYYSANYWPNNGGYNDLYTAARATIEAPFGPHTILKGTWVSVSDYVSDPSVTRDGLILFFGWAALGTPQHISYARRHITSDSFSYMGLVPNVNGPADVDGGEDVSPFLREDDQVLYFASNRVLGNGDDIFQAKWNGTDFDAPTPVQELNTTFDDRAPVVTPDDRTIFFASKRPDPHARGDFDIWTATRRSPSDPFSSPTLVTELNTDGGDAPTFVTRDACTLYFSMNVAGCPEAQYVAERPSIGASER